MMVVEKYKLHHVNGVASPNSALTQRSRERDATDGLAAPRGIVLALLISLCFWILVFALLR